MSMELLNKDHSNLLVQHFSIVVQLLKVYFCYVSMELLDKDLANTKGLLHTTPQSCTAFSIAVRLFTVYYCYMSMELINKDHSNTEGQLYSTLQSCTAFSIAVRLFRVYFCYVSMELLKIPFKYNDKLNLTILYCIYNCSTVVYSLFILYVYGTAQ